MPILPPGSPLDSSYFEAVGEAPGWGIDHMAGAN